MGHEVGLAQRFAEEAIHAREGCRLAVLVEDIGGDRDDMGGG